MLVFHVPLFNIMESIFEAITNLGTLFYTTRKTVKYKVKRAPIKSIHFFFHSNR